MHRAAFPLIIFACVCAALWAAEQAQFHWGLGAVAILSGAAALSGLYYLLFGQKLAMVLVRASMALIPVGALAGGLIFAVLQIPNLDEDIRRALIAAVVVASGWIVGYLTGEWRRVSTEQERRRDLIRAAISELDLIIRHFEEADWDGAIADARDKFSKSARYEVFVFYGHEYTTLKRLVEQVEVLSWNQIEPVMDVYQALDRLDRMEAKMDTDGFRALPKPRREAALVRYLKLHIRVLELSEDAAEALRNGPFRGWLAGFQ